jgi:hypothetical protein
MSGTITEHVLRDDQVQNLLNDIGWIGTIRMRITPSMERLYRLSQIISQQLHITRPRYVEVQRFTNRKGSVNIARTYDTFVAIINLGPQDIAVKREKDPEKLINVGSIYTDNGIVSTSVPPRVRRNISGRNSTVLVLRNTNDISDFEKPSRGVAKATIFEAANNGNVAFIDNALRLYEDPDTEELDTLIMVSTLSLPIFLTILKRIPDIPQLFGRYGARAAQLAMDGRPDTASILRELLQRGMPYTPNLISVAAREGRAENVRILLEYLKTSAATNGESSEPLYQQSLDQALDEARKSAQDRYADAAKKQRVMALIQELESLGAHRRT